MCVFCQERNGVVHVCFFGSVFLWVRGTGSLLLLVDGQVGSSGFAGLKSCRVVVFLLLLLESLCYNDVERSGGY